MKREWIEVVTYEEEGYAPVIDFEQWRVAVLNYCEELEVQNITSMQKHNETDEVFVLLKGNCTLFTGGAESEISEIDAIKMEPLKFYNVKKGVYHTHTLDTEGSVLIVENRNTCDENSTTKVLTQEQLSALYQVNIV